MKYFMHNKKGAIYISIIFILLIALVLPISLLRMLVSNNITISSNNDNYRAGYIVESILELKIEEIMKLCDQTVSSYKADLQTYHTEYIENLDNDNDTLYNPPDFNDYIRELIPDIRGLGESANSPFEEYKEKHYYKVDVECDLNKNCVNITSKGEYKRARKFINVELELPVIIDNGVDENGFPQINVVPAKVVKYYQTFGL